ncbi:AAA family ATPase [Candidatus Micrarchaeota archaeon]|nr:AAA family ATPase [Candidatus Micrarchaeota archaeon]
MNILITGTPGTGKTFFAKELSKKLGLELVDVTALVKEKKIYKKQGRELEVDLKKLKKELEKKDDCIIESHLLCEFSLGKEVIVLRCNPKELEKRLNARNYSKKKVLDNVLLEALDYCLIKSEENYATVRQLDNTRGRALANFLNKKFDSNVRWLNEETIKKHSRLQKA